MKNPPVAVETMYKRYRGGIFDAEPQRTAEDAENFSGAMYQARHTVVEAECIELYE